MRCIIDNRILFVVRLAIDLRKPDAYPFARVRCNIFSRINILKTAVGVNRNIRGFCQHIGNGRAARHHCVFQNSICDIQLVTVQRDSPLDFAVCIVTRCFGNSIFIVQWDFCRISMFNFKRFICRRGRNPHFIFQLVIDIFHVRNLVDVSDLILGMGTLQPIFRHICLHLRKRALDFTTFRDVQRMVVYRFPFCGTSLRPSAIFVGSRFRNGTLFHCDGRRAQRQALQVFNFVIKADVARRAFFRNDRDRIGQLMRLRVIAAALGRFDIIGVGLISWVCDIFFRNVQRDITIERNFNGAVLFAVLRANFAVEINITFDLRLAVQIVLIEFQQNCISAIFFLDKTIVANFR